MLAVLTAKWTGDALTNGKSVYDIHGELKGFTKVEPPDDIRLLNATLRDIRVSTGSGAVAAAPPAPLWATKGRVWSRDLVSHCRAAGSEAGFPVLSIGSPASFAGISSNKAEVELLGWANTERILNQLAVAGRSSGAVGVDAETSSFWCQFTPAKVHKSPPGDLHVEDLSHAIEAKAVVRVRGDCPLQTAFCVFQNCPGVRALVSVDGAPFFVQTTTRDLFVSCLGNSSLCALSSEGSPLNPADSAASKTRAALRSLSVLPNSGLGCEKWIAEGTEDSSQKH
jgi:hypothetical protein